MELRGVRFELLHLQLLQRIIGSKLLDFGGLSDIVTQISSRKMRKSNAAIIFCELPRYLVLLAETVKWHLVLPCLTILSESSSTQDLQHSVLYGRHAGNFHLCDPRFTFSSACARFPSSSSGLIPPYSCIRRVLKLNPNYQIQYSNWLRTLERLMKSETLKIIWALLCPWFSIFHCPTRGGNVSARNCAVADSLLYLIFLLEPRHMVMHLAAEDVRMRWNN